MASDADGWRYCWWTVPSGMWRLACGKPAVTSRKVPARMVTEPCGQVRRVEGYEMGLCAEHAKIFDQTAVHPDTPPTTLDLIIPALTSRHWKID